MEDALDPYAGADRVDNFSHDLGFLGSPDIPAGPEYHLAARLKLQAGMTKEDTGNFQPVPGTAGRMLPVRVIRRSQREQPVGFFAAFKSIS